MSGTFTLLREPYEEVIQHTRPLTLRRRFRLIWALLTHRNVVHW